MSDGKVDFPDIPEIEFNVADIRRLLLLIFGKLIELECSTIHNLSVLMRFKMTDPEKAEKAMKGLLDSVSDDLQSAIMEVCKQGGHE